MRIVSHKTLSGDAGQYSTNPNHMPDNHRQYLEHTPDKIRKWAKTLGYNTEKFVEYILENHVEKKALTILLSVQNLTKYYSQELIEQRFNLFVDYEYSRRQSNKLKRLIKQATLNEPTAMHGVVSFNALDGLNICNCGLFRMQYSGMGGGAIDIFNEKT